ncbi:MAG: bis(5'-nucleosyl)-tetraphosphatase (symmetrical) YqeK [Ruminococcus sp.]|nr:bis(5'-nucleosyl)-tetraphosphatase (symmetrical) YqeK [Ruminococcus sp.]MCD7799952.1 bis(5'-nucleosyl)-tetraphosphatase (symmetrical) YqeK [Ruminococcus sp.]
MYNIDETKKLLEKRLSRKRFVHSLNVAEQCRILAELNSEDVEKCTYAGLLHDICKEVPWQDMKKMLIDATFPISREELCSKPLWHAIAGAWFIRTQLNVNDDDIINAVRFHTVARSGMTKVEEIVYMADLISVDRDYKDVKKIRRLAYSDLELAMFEAIKFSITDVISKNSFIPHYTMEAYNQYAYIYKNKVIK